MQLFNWIRDNLLSSIDQAILHNKYNINKKKLLDEVEMLDKSRQQSYKNYLSSDMINILDKVSYESRS